MSTKKPAPMKALEAASGARKIKNLKDHPEPYVTTTELAEYWMVSRKQVYKQIEAGTLKAIRLGPRLLRISTADAADFERHAKITPHPHIDGEDVVGDPQPQPHAEVS
jgi:excisionase family DNA binding protein